MPHRRRVAATAPPATQLRADSEVAPVGGPVGEAGSEPAAPMQYAAAAEAEAEVAAGGLGPASGSDADGSRAAEDVAAAAAALQPVPESQAAIDPAAPAPAPAEAAAGGFERLAEGMARDADQVRSAARGAATRAGSGPWRRPCAAAVGGPRASWPGVNGCGGRCGVWAARRRARRRRSRRNRRCRRDTALLLHLLLPLLHLLLVFFFLLLHLLYLLLLLLLLLRLFPLSAGAKAVSPRQQPSFRADGAPVRPPRSRRALPH